MNDQSLNKQLQIILKDDFGITDIQDYKRVPLGMMCNNFSFISSGKKYFLKQYRRREGISLYDVKASEALFSENGFPVILPELNKEGEGTFKIKDDWWSLFPFIDGYSPTADTLNPNILAYMGKMLASIHEISTRKIDYPFKKMPFWNTGAFLKQVQKVEEAASKMVLTDVEAMSLLTLTIQKDYVEKNRPQPDHFFVRRESLLHGDFIYQNVFIENDKIIYLYDFERTGLGPRAFELARSLFLNCFDDGWNEKNYEFARILLCAYQTIYPIKKAELLKGAQMYVADFMHTSWMETKVIIEKSKLHSRLVEPAHKRVKHFVEGVDSIIDTIFVD